MSYTFYDLAVDVLMTVRKPLTIYEIWEHGINLGLAQKLGTSGKTPWQTLGARIYVDLKENPNTKFVQVSKRPAMFYLKELYGNSEDYQKNEEKKVYLESKVNAKPEYCEKDLHVLLTAFVYSNPHFNCYTRTILHENSKKAAKGYNKWLRPDMVGVYFPFDKYQNNVLKLLDTFKENSYKLFSFEIKIELNLSNLRQSYFQAVSNSSWANEGYLVALKIEDEPSLIDEIRRLNSAFGIGVIRLDAKNIEESEILFSARTNNTLDWETIDRLAEENPDFSDFIDNVIEDIKIGKVKSKYDRILNADEYEKYIKEKGLV
ncbi:HrgA protein [Thermoclostridium stercorarium subsp. leptospartum DSM 9219]|uniref:HrgA protein n=1 Tax=Thermoclostridium stercorarium subsp. leptospartum DSM 9219 TaxID=1346611 RepID=A0A1B1YLN4_THEST|nr:HTH domain-containing protein [Thermoclostridium stercorarium]ANX01681.1 HrgA protein [Thermoclostridium stercorarium subsp. leptospartum DSM 9219]